MIPAWLKPKIHGSAVFSDDGSLRFVLERWWDEGDRVALWGMLNPSTADAEKNDPTLWQVLKWTYLLDCNRAVIVNYEPYVTSSPARLQQLLVLARFNRNDGPVRHENLLHVRAASKRATVRIVAFGNSFPIPRDAKFLRALSLDGTVPLHCLGTTADGTPKHPMARGRHRIPDNQQLVVWLPERERSAA